MSSWLTDRGGNHEGGNGNEYFPSHKQHSFSYLYLSTFYKSRLDCASCYFNKKKNQSKVFVTIFLNGCTTMWVSLALKTINLSFVHSSPSPSQTSKECSWWGFPSVCIPTVCGKTFPACYAEMHTCRAPEVTGVPATHTRTEFIGHAWLGTNYLLLCIPTCAVHTWERHFSTSSFTCSRKWSHFFISLFLSHLFPHLFFCSFYFNNFRLSFFEATQSATSEKVISDSSLYWD